MIEQILSYKTLFFNIVTTISYVFLSAINKRLNAALVKIRTSGGDPLFHTYYDGAFAMKTLPTQSISYWKSEGAKFRLCCECVEKSTNWYGA